MNSPTPRSCSSALICCDSDGPDQQTCRRPAEIELLGDRHEVTQLAQFHDPTCYVQHWEDPPFTREKSGRGGSVRCGQTMSP